MLFRKKIKKSCCYCKYGTKLDDNSVLCTKWGIVEIGKKCRKFSYDPCKRIPMKTKAPDFEKYANEDYSL